MYINPSDLDTIQWEPTSICNANCICCPRTDHDTMLTKPWILKFQHHTSEEQYNAVIKSFCDPRLQKLRKIVYNGNIGDAMMHPFIDKILIGIAKEKPNLAQEVHTNGGGKWAKKIENVCKYIVDNDYKPRINFVFSIDGLEDTNHLYRRNVVWKNIMENVDVFKKYDIHCTWRWNTFDHNKHQIDEARQLAESWKWFFKVNEGTFGQDEVTENYKKESNQKLYKQKIKLNIEDDLVTYDEDPNLPPLHAGRSIAKKDICPWKTNNDIQIMSDMTVWPCCWTSHFHYIYSLGYEQLWKGDKFVSAGKLGVSDYNISFIREWDLKVGRDYDKNKDVKITNDHLLYDVLVSDTYKHIGDMFNTHHFQLDVCKATCRSERVNLEFDEDGRQFKDHNR